MIQFLKLQRIKRCVCIAFLSMSVTQANAMTRVNDYNDRPISQTGTPSFTINSVNKEKRRRTTLSFYFIQSTAHFEFYSRFPFHQHINSKGI